MKKISSKTHWIIDLGLMVGFLAAFCLDLTGISLHQWLGLAVTILALVHLILHWDWVTAVFNRFFMKSSGRSRVYLLMNFLIMLGAVVIFETGLVISTWFALDLTNYADWLDIHIYASVITLGLTVLKLGLHWRWIINVAQKNLQKTRGGARFPNIKTGAGTHPGEPEGGRSPSIPGADGSSRRGVGTGCFESAFQGEKCTICCGNPINNNSSGGGNCHSNYSPGDNTSWREYNYPHSASPGGFQHYRPGLYRSLPQGMLLPRSLPALYGQ